MKLITFIAVAAAFFFFPLISADATPEFAEETGKTCALCHQDPNGGALTTAGIGYIRNGYNYPVPERILAKAEFLGNPFHRNLRLILLYIHIVAASVLAGTIFYIHIFIKPASLKGGIPKGEKLLGLSCMSIVTATGVYLTWYRMDSLSSFGASSFGMLLLIKIILFIVLALLGILAVTIVNKKMRAQANTQTRRGTGEKFSIERLSIFDGREGRPAYVQYKNKVYDVSASDKWPEGSHFRKHAAGKDLTEELAGAPHGEEIFKNVPVVSIIGPGELKQSREKPRGVQKLYIVMAYVNLGLIFGILFCVAGWLAGGFLPKKADIVMPYQEASSSCVACHQKDNPGITGDWAKSIHKKVGTGCAECHKVENPKAQWVSSEHFEYSNIPVSSLVTPSRCSQCHQEEAAEYSLSKHANTIQIINTIDKWMIHGMNNEVERSTGCYACHGTQVEFIEGQPVKGTWPNVGVGRVNPDGSLGSCTSCHTRHSFSVAEARKPEACDQCHLGPDHPQIEIYNESKHGTIYHAEGDSWTWRPDDNKWTAGRDYRAPTCSVCHMPDTHDVTRRLAWELQAPLTIRPGDFAAFPAGTDWQEERKKMESVCRKCHSEEWVRGHFTNMDNAVALYNNEYYLPISLIMDELYKQGYLTSRDYFDEPMEWEFYELWHHEGRRARMGAAMMAPDYAWWHGFYELKHRFLSITEEARVLELQSAGKWNDLFPGRKEENNVYDGE